MSEVIEWYKNASVEDRMKFLEAIGGERMGRTKLYYVNATEPVGKDTYSITGTIEFK